MGHRKALSSMWTVDLSGNNLGLERRGIPTVWELALVLGTSDPERHRASHCR